MPTKRARQTPPTKPAKPASPSAQLETFLKKYTPAIAAQARAALLKLRRRCKGATELVYDNYNALVIGFGPNDRAGQHIFSLACYPDHITLCFLPACSPTNLYDPKNLLQGGGRVVRHIRLSKPSDLDQPDIADLMTAALESADTPLDPKQKRTLIIKSISAKQRPRRPEPKPKKAAR